MTFPGNEKNKMYPRIIILFPSRGNLLALNFPFLVSA